MVRLTKIYTRGGDDGTTSLADGTRRGKHDLRIASYGAVDEANAAIGVARLFVAKSDTLDAVLARLQNDLFDLGADLATPDKDDKAALRVSAAQVKRLEDEIDMLNAPLKPLDSFVLPGGSQAAAHLHLARTIIRRAERLAVALQNEAGETLSAHALELINRASDLLFVAARHANDGGRDDVLWQAGRNR